MSNSNVSVRTLGEAYPTVRDQLELLEPDLSTRPLLPLDKTCNILLDSIIKRQAALASTNPLALFAESQDVIVRTIELKRLLAEPRDLLAMSFIQFVTATGVLSHCVGTGKMQRATKWIIAALSPQDPWSEPPFTAQFDVSRVFRFIISDIDCLRSEAYYMTCRWLDFSYTAFIFGDLFTDFATTTLPVAKAFAIVALYAGIREALNALISIGAWSAKHKIDAKEIAGILEFLIAHSHPRSPLIVAALCGRLSRYSTRSAEQWAQLLYEQYRDAATPPERLMAITVLASGNGGE